MVFAFDQDEEIDAKRPEPHGRIDLVSPVRCLPQFAVLYIKPFKRIAGLGHEAQSKLLQLRSVESRSMIR